MLNLHRKRFMIFGLPDSGKSNLACHLLFQYKQQALVYDTLNEYPDTPIDRYIPKDRHDTGELEKLTRLVMQRKRYSLFFIDELNRYCPSKPATLPQAIADLNDWAAHYAITFGGAARRPCQINQDLTELAHYLFIFALPGKNDIDFLNSQKVGLGDAAATLKPYHFIVFDRQTFYVHKPVPLMPKQKGKV